jgi:hypothetical protein
MRRRGNFLARAALRDEFLPVRTPQKVEIADSSFGTRSALRPAVLFPVLATPPAALDSELLMLVVPATPQPGGSGAQPVSTEGSTYALFPELLENLCERDIEIGQNEDSLEDPDVPTPFTPTGIQWLAQPPHVSRKELSFPVEVLDQPSGAAPDPADAFFEQPRVMDGITPGAAESFEPAGRPDGESGPDLPPFQFPSQTPRLFREATEASRAEELSGRPAPPVPFDHAPDEPQSGLPRIDTRPVTSGRPRRMKVNAAISVQTRPIPKTDISRSPGPLEATGEAHLAQSNTNFAEAIPIAPSQSLEDARATRVLSLTDSASPALAPTPANRETEPALVAELPCSASETLPAPPVEPVQPASRNAAQEDSRKPPETAGKPSRRPNSPVSREVWPGTRSEPTHSAAQHATENAPADPAVRTSRQPAPDLPPEPTLQGPVRVAFEARLVDLREAPGLPVPVKTPVKDMPVKDTSVKGAPAAPVREMTHGVTQADLATVLTSDGKPRPSGPVRIDRAPGSEALPAASPRLGVALSGRTAPHVADRTAGEHSRIQGVPWRPRPENQAAHSDPQATALKPGRDPRVSVREVAAPTARGDRPAFATSEPAPESVTPPVIGTRTAPEAAAAVTPGPAPEPRVAAPARRAEQVAPSTRVEQTTIEPRQPATAAKDIRIGVESGERRVEVRLVERAGEVHVTVRTPDDRLSGALRDNLPDLATRLEQTGYRAEPLHGAAFSQTEWRRDELQPAGAQNSGGQTGQEHRRHQDQPQPREPQDFEQPNNRKEKGREFAWFIASLT